MLARKLLRWDGALAVARRASRWLQGARRLLAGKLLRWARPTLLALAGTGALLAAASEAPAEEPWVWAADWPLGRTLPDLALTDHQGEKVWLADLGGEQGTLLIFSRSTEW